MELSAITARLNEVSNENLSNEQVVTLLANINLTAEKVTPPMLEQWITDGIEGLDDSPKGHEIKGSKGRSRSKKTTATEIQSTEPAPWSKAIAPVTTASPATSPNDAIVPAEASQPAHPQEPEEIPIDFNTDSAKQVVGHVENLAVGMILQLEQQMDLMADGVAACYQKAPHRFAQKVNARIGIQASGNPLADLNESWAAAATRINQLITNVSS